MALIKSYLRVNYLGTTLLLCVKHDKWLHFSWIWWSPYLHICFSYSSSTASSLNRAYIIGYIWNIHHAHHVDLTTNMWSLNTELKHTHYKQNKHARFTLVLIWKSSPDVICLPLLHKTGYIYQFTPKDNQDREPLRRQAPVILTSSFYSSSAARRYFCFDGLICDRTTSLILTETIRTGKLKMEWHIFIHRGLFFFKEKSWSHPLLLFGAF